MDCLCISDMMKRRKHSAQLKLLLDLFGWIQASAFGLLPASGVEVNGQNHLHFTFKCIYLEATEWGISRSASVSA